ncbi:MAG: HIT family protein [Patescibacteria group bacterium]|jgi:diadenosine tetraphosphate (Ap4A) HIT family hydrolase
MKEFFPKPFKDAIIYQDDKLYACLANSPIVNGHVVVVWNKKISDLHLLNRKDYEYLMDRVNDVRRAMMKTLKVKKVYLLYMDEIKHVHWHLIPRYDKLGIQNLTGRPGKIKDFTLDNRIKENLIITTKNKKQISKV